LGYGGGVLKVYRNTGRLSIWKKWGIPCQARSFALDGALNKEILLRAYKRLEYRETIKPFLLFQGSPAEKRDLFNTVSTSRFGAAGLRIPLDKLGAAVSPLIRREKDSGLPPVTAEKT
jgi:hypothetical protein